MSEVIRYHKVVSTLPSTLESNSVYYVRVGVGVDVFVTNNLGTVTAYRLNPPVITSAGINVTTDVTLTNSNHDHVVTINSSSPVTVTIDPATLIPGFRVVAVRRGGGTVAVHVGDGVITSLSTSNAGTVVNLELNETAHFMVLSSSEVFVNFPDRAAALAPLVTELQTALSVLDGTVANLASRNPRTISTSAPTGVPRDGEEWIVV